MRKWVKDLIFKSSKHVGGSIEYKLEQLLYTIKSAKFFHREKLPDFKNRYEMFNHIIHSFNLKEENVTYLEFGVWQGESITFWASQNQNKESFFCGFDTFEGLPEAWGKLSKGHFSTEGKTPETADKRISFQKGLFQNTLPGFIEINQPILKGKRKIIHLDADLYSSTLFVLLELFPYFEPGDIILFDELFTLRNNSEEFRAFLDFRAIRDFNYKVIGNTDKQFAIVKV